MGIWARDGAARTREVARRAKAKPRARAISPACWVSSRGYWARAAKVRARAKVGVNLAANRRLVLQTCLKSGRRKSVPSTKREPRMKVARRQAISFISAPFYSEVRNTVGSNQAISENCQ